MKLFLSYGLADADVHGFDGFERGNFKKRAEIVNQRDTYF